MPLSNAHLGVIGGGQLGMMFVQAARAKGCYTMVYDPDEDSPAATVCHEHFCADYRNSKALKKMAEGCDAVTIEFENVPASALDVFAGRVFLAPSAEALEIVQDRISEKNYLRSLGIKTVNFAAIKKAKDLDAAWKKLSAPIILKTARLGYDGKGQQSAETLAQAKKAFVRLGKQPCIAEEKAPFVCEISVVLARMRDGETRCFPVTENEHRHGILHRSSAPAGVEKSIEEEAKLIACRIADGLDYCGILCVEFFVLEDNKLLVNEIAPRTHNSGHYTLDACTTSQFDQQVNVLCDAALGETQLLQPVTMVNLLGSLWIGTERMWHKLFPEGETRLHWYGKKEPRPKRKMGHFCVLGDTVEETVQTAEDIYRRLSNGI